MILISHQKKKILWGSTQNAGKSQKKQAKVCGQIKIANVAHSPSHSQVEAPSTQTYPMVCTISQCHAGIGTNASVQTFLSLLGRLGGSGFAQ